MKFVLLVLAMALATANAAACSFKKMSYNPAPITDFTQQKVNTDFACSRGTEIIATDWTKPYNAIAKKLLTKFVFPGLSGDWKDTYDCGKPGIRTASVDGIAGCLTGNNFHGDVCISYSCNQQARQRKVCVDGTMQLSGNCKP